ncbi:MAG: ParB/RepB/Spo0J family partition protein [Ruminococcus sp.]|nr:ParB/RepB/Spo0J family partition protein [Ruminococcus sp.]
MSGLLTFTKEKSMNQVVLLHADWIQPISTKSEMELNPAEIQMLMKKISQGEAIEPIDVRKTDCGYEVVSGAPWLYAAKLAGLQTIPCIVNQTNSRDAAILELVEYIRTQNLNFFEEAAAIEKLISFYGMTQEDAASHLGKAQSTIANKLRLLRLTDEERELIMQHHLTERHARALLRLGSAHERLQVLNLVIQQGFNVEKTEFAIEQVIGGRKKREPYRKRNRTIQSIRTFMNALNKAVHTMESTGIRVDMQRVQKENTIEFCIRIPCHFHDDVQTAHKFMRYH